MGDPTTTVTPPRQPLRPLLLLFWGLVTVVVDVRIDEVDLVPDPAGWLLALVAASRMARWHRAFLLAAAGCVLGLLVSLPDWLQPGPSWTQQATAVAETALVFGTCTGLMTLLPGRRRRADAIRWWDLGLMLVTVLVVVSATLDGGPPWPGRGGVRVAVVLLLGLATVVVFVAFLVLVLRASKDLPENRPEPA